MGRTFERSALVDAGMRVVAARQATSRKAFSLGSPRASRTSLSLSLSLSGWAARAFRGRRCWPIPGCPRCPVPVPSSVAGHSGTPGSILAASARLVSPCFFSPRAPLGRLRPRAGLRKLPNQHRRQRSTAAFLVHPPFLHLPVPAVLSSAARLLLYDSVFCNFLLLLCSCTFGCATSYLETGVAIRGSLHIPFSAPKLAWDAAHAPTSREPLRSVFRFQAGKVEPCSWALHLQRAFRGRDEPWFWGLRLSL